MAQLATSSYPIVEHSHLDWGSKSEKLVRLTWLSLLLRVETILVLYLEVEEALR